jgi:hypothetical protein
MGGIFLHAARSVRIALAMAALCLVAVPSTRAAQTDIHGPAGSVGFGTDVKALPNGNFVVVDPEMSSGTGAVYLYSAAGTLISTLTGSSADDHVGRGGIVVVNGSKFVIMSPDWDNGTATDAGAVTWIDDDVGLNGPVTSANSLVGTTAGDKVGSGGVFVLSNGNYVVASPGWNSTRLGLGHVYVVTPQVGAVTWGDGAHGATGAIQDGNSLVGTVAGDEVGSGGVTALRNGNYAVASPYWDNGATADVGAATWGEGTHGITGAVLAANSLVGTSVADYVGSNGITALNNGNYVVVSSLWQHSTGAVTWGDGMHGITGTVSADNSLVGTSPFDLVGGQFGKGVFALSNGNYVVTSPEWNNGTMDTYVGAATWGDGTHGTTGAVSAVNSLVGSTAGDSVGGSGVAVLSNGNYVVASPSWDNGATANVGAATWGDGTHGTTGEVSAANSLVGTTADDQVGRFLFVLGGVTALSDGNYVVSSPYWNNGATVDAGAATWGDGTHGTTGAVSAVNSLVGSTAGDKVGGNVIALADGNYAVLSPYWNNHAWMEEIAGAMTWCRGGGLTLGPVTLFNSLIGAKEGDEVGNAGGKAYSDGNYVVQSSYWNRYYLDASGAITLASGKFRMAGAVLPWNSVIGGVDNGGPNMHFDYDTTRHRLIVGRPAENIVSLFTMEQIFADGLEL